MRARRAAELRRLGWTNRAIAAELGVHPTTVTQLVKRAHSSRRCDTCGEHTMRPSQHRECWDCTNRLWSPARIIDAIREWHSLEGQPPRVADWDPAQATRKGRPEAARRFRDDGCWPFATSVINQFGSWNRAVAAAGFTPRQRAGGPGRMLPDARRADVAVSILTRAGERLRRAPYGWGKAETTTQSLIDAAVMDFVARAGGTPSSVARLLAAMAQHPDDTLLTKRQRV